MNFKIETPKIKKKNINTFQGFNKFSFLLSFIMLFSAFAYPKAYTQNNISFDVQNESIISVLDRIESQTPLRFIFGSEIYDFEKTITLTVEKASLKDVIYLIFDNKLSYELSDNVVILSKSVSSEEAPKQESTESTQQKVVQFLITGNVTDNNGYPLPGASVIESGTTNGTTTDFDGNFSINVNDENSILEISYIGFITQKVAADSTNPISVMMQTDVSSLDNVVLVGYGKQNRRDITSSISVLDLEGTAEKANTNVGQLLQSRSAGVRVVQGTGKPEPPKNVQIIVEQIRIPSGAGEATH